MAFDPIEYINTPRWQHQRLGLERIQALMAKLGNPQERLRFVHVAGTNGKGSVCAYLARCLETAGYKTGLFTSPYIERFEERIRINGCDISADDLYSATVIVRDAADEVEREIGEHPTEFELMCAVALVHFERQGCEVAVIEVGLGGRLDSTNIIVPDLSIITRIGLDHTDILGDTLAEIAAEKAGIVKPGVPVVAYPQGEEVMAVIRSTCEERGCDLYLPDFSSVSVGGIEACGMREFDYAGRHYKTHMLATYQPYNAALAITAAEVLTERGYFIGHYDTERGIGSAVWPGRFEVAGGDPLFIIDGAHNPQGARELRTSLEDFVGSVPNGFSDEHGEGAADAAGRPDAIFVTGVLADKDYKGMLEALIGACDGGGVVARAGIVAPADDGESQTGFESERNPSDSLFHKVTFVTYTPDNPRALDSQSYARAIASYVERGVAGALAARPFDVRACDSAEKATELAIDIASSANSDHMQIIVAFGTLYAIGQIKATLRSIAP